MPKSPASVLKRLAPIAGVAALLLALDANSVLPDGGAAVAQDRRGGFNIFRPLQRLLEGPQANRGTRVIRVKPRKTRRSTRSAAAPAPQRVEKSADAATVVVIGDFLASGLGRGLTEAYADNPNVVVVSMGMPSSGLVREDHYNWPGEVESMLVEGKPADLGVIMVGANDSQPIRARTGQIPVRTDEWTAEYKARVEKLANLFIKAGKPIVWVGLPPMKSASLSASLAQINDLQEQVVTAMNMPFVDIWDAFANEDGRYTTQGPDQTGQIRRLRTSDGINLAQAGRRKVAFFAQVEITRLLGESGTLMAGPPVSASTLSAAGALGRVRPAVWEVVLTGDQSDRGTAILAGQTLPGGDGIDATEPPRGDQAAILAAQRLRYGATPASRTGRVDDTQSLLPADTPPL